MSSPMATSAYMAPTCTPRIVALTKSITGVRRSARPRLRRLQGAVLERPRLGELDVGHRQPEVAGGREVVGRLQARVRVRLEVGLHLVGIGALGGVGGELDQV